MPLSCLFHYTGSVSLFRVISSFLYNVLIELPYIKLIIKMIALLEWFTFSNLIIVVLHLYSKCIWLWKQSAFSKSDFYLSNKNYPWSFLKKIKRERLETFVLYLLNIGFYISFCFGLIKISAYFQKKNCYSVYRKQWFRGNWTKWTATENER